MPVYEYKCDECGERFEKLTSVGGKEVSVKCPKCGGSARRIISTLLKSGKSECSCTTCGTNTFT